MIQGAYANGWTDEIKSQDAVYVVTYSIIMLNTDQHNPQVKVSDGIRLIRSHS
jgi:Sec7-like guanine-nucleotide exchange factor